MLSSIYRDPDSITGPNNRALEKFCRNAKVGSFDDGLRIQNSAVYLNQGPYPGNMGVVPQKEGFFVKSQEAIYLER